MADEIRRLIRVRTRKAANFKRDGFGKKPQLSSSWRKPRGQHNKQREQKKAKGNLPKPGFGSPISVRGMHPSGFFEILVHTIDDLEGLNPKSQAVRIASTVGGKKRAAIQDKALASGLRVLNAKAAEPVKKTPSAAPEEKKAVKEVPEKKKPVKKAKAAAETKKKPDKVRKEPAQEVKAPAKKKTREPGQTEPVTEQEPKKEQKRKASKPAAETAPESKPKKPGKVKAKPADAEPPKESKPATKSGSKSAAKPKKKTGKEVKGNE